MKELETQHVLACNIEFEDHTIDPTILQDLSDSIKDSGLLHPITVQSVNGKYKLVTGEKRLKACMILGITEIPCRIVEGTDKQILLTKIEENLRRENLDWWDLASLVSKWHETKQTELGIAEAKKGKEKREKPGWSMRDTAEELGRSLGFVSESVMLDHAVKNDASLKNIRDRGTALRIVRAKTARIESEQDAERPVDFAVDQVFNGAAAEILKQFPASSFDACITDPPWLKFIDDKLTRDDETVPVFKELYRVLRSNAFLYLFCGLDDYRSYLRRLPEFGYTVSKTPLIWVKKELRESKLHGVVLSKGARPWEYSRDFELILLAVKGSPSLTHSTQRSSVFVHAPLAPVTLTHPNEKPVELIQELVEDCTYEGSIIIDPFAGSGSHLEACKNTSRRWVGIERDHTFYNAIVERMKDKKKKVKK